MILYEHYFKDGQVGMNEVEVIEHPKTFKRPSGSFSCNYRSYIRKNELDTIMAKWGSYYMYTVSVDAEKSFIEKVLDIQRRKTASTKMEYEIQNERHEKLLDLLHSL